MKISPTSFNKKDLRQKQDGIEKRISELKEKLKRYCIFIVQKGSAYGNL